MPQKKAKSPNVVVFFTDQQRWDCSGLHGNPLGLTPNLDRMALEGIHCYNAVTCQPVCGPARACLQTGQYATTTGVFRNGLALERDANTLARHFKAGGYHTGYIGKWHLASERIVVPEEEQGGYDYWLGANVLESCSEPYNAVMFDKKGRRVKLPGYRVDALTDAAIRYLDAHQHEPFFLFVSYLEPHFQNHLDDYPPPDGYREPYTGRWMPPDLQALGGSAAQHLGGYWGMIKRLDEALGRMLDALKSLGLLDDTIVLFTSDHGCHFKTRNGEYKRSCHEASVRIPLAVRGPGFEGGGRHYEAISLVDVPPTLLDAAGLPVPDDMQGISFLPLARGDSSGRPDDAFIQISESQVGRAVRTRRWKYSVYAPDGRPRADAAATRYREEFLYDLEADPYELRNLIDCESHRGVAAVMRQRLVRWIEKIEGITPVIEEAPTKKRGLRRVDPGEELL